MKVREFARHIGVSHPAVLKACNTGRLSKSVRRDARGRVVDIDPSEGSREWERNRGRLSSEELHGKRQMPTHAPARRERPPAAEIACAPSLGFGGLEAMDQAGVPFVAIRFPLDSFVAGAVQALLEQGKEAGPDVLQELVLTRDPAWWWATVYGALSSALRTDEIPAADLPVMWELSGRDAVLGDA